MPKHGQREKVHTIIFSDLHVSSALFKAKVLREVLNGYEAEQFVGNGDIFDHANFNISMFTPFRSRMIGREGRPQRVPRSHLDFMEDVNGRAKRGCRVQYVPGNHDDQLWQVLACFLGASVCDEEYEWTYRGKKFLAIHGDQFDSFYHKYKWTSEIATRLYELMQLMGPHADWLCSLAKSRSKHYTRAIDYVAQGATLHASHRGVHHVFCGHTHHPEHRFLNEVHYYNSGSWTASGDHKRKDYCSLITIGPKGIRIHYFDNDAKEVKIDGPYPI